MPCFGWMPRELQVVLFHDRDAFDSRDSTFLRQHFQVKLTSMLSLTFFILLLHPILLLAQSQSVPVHRGLLEVGFTLPLQRTSVVQPFSGIKPEILESQAPISNVQR